MPFARRAAALLLLCGPAPLAAQDMPTILPNDYVLHDILNQQRIEASIGRPNATRARPTPAARSASTTSYRPSPAVSARVREQFTTAMTRVVGAQGSRQLAGALSAGDPVRNWLQFVGSDGLRGGDAADALASYWILNWVMANDADSDRSQALAVRAQVRGVLLANPGFTRLTEAQRQEMAETLILNFLMQHAAYGEAVRRGDRDLKARLGAAAVARFRNEMGLDLRGLRLTAAGFARR
ncbi:DUF6683 family protein [Novosphingobium sp. PS1R-30]|uniref:DUF6683 family protein n=1 Tax=Novosphingobium anseongense TaxID=3133436 RepID=A0ABU8RXQ3_9SPHN